MDNKNKSELVAENVSLRARLVEMETRLLEQSPSKGERCTNDNG
jgi:hypothetical protein